MVGTLDDIQVMFDNYQGMTPFYQRLESMEQSLDIMEVQTGGWLIEDEERRRLVFLADKVGEFHTLVLTAGEGAGVLAELDIAQSNLLQRFEFADDDAAGIEIAYMVLELFIAEELYRLVHGHVQHIIDILSSVVYLQDIVLEPLALACLAGKGDICHKLHFDGYVSSSLAFLASSALGIEGEELWGESHLLGEWLVGKEDRKSVV